MFHRLARDDRWRNYHIYSLVIAVIALFMALMYKLHGSDNLAGIFQRISFGLPLLWIEIMAIKLFTILKKNVVEWS